MSEGTAPASLDGQTPAGTLAGGLAVTNQAGYRWLERGGRWIDYDGNGSTDYANADPDTIPPHDYATPGIRQHCLKLGADAVFQKTHEMQAFIDWCSALVGPIEPPKSPAAGRPAK